MLCKDNTVSALCFISSYSLPEEKVETVKIRINQNIIKVGVYERQRFEVQTRKYVVYTLYGETGSALQVQENFHKSYTENC